MTATDLRSLDPAAAAYVAQLSAASTADLLAAHGDTDPTATLAVIRRAVAAHLPRIAA